VNVGLETQGTIPRKPVMYLAQNISVLIKLYLQCSATHVVNACEKYLKCNF